LSLAVRNGRNLDFDSKEARAAMVTDLDDAQPSARRAVGLPGLQQNNVNQTGPQPAQPKPPQPATANAGKQPQDSQRKVQSVGHGFSRAVQDPNVIAALAAEGERGAAEALAIAEQLLEAAS
ncbi:MAG TPA: hypothetical protein VF753_11630, partial [Terriglobales bacterium]